MKISKNELKTLNNKSEFLIRIISKYAFFFLLKIINIIILKNNKNKIKYVLYFEIFHIFRLHVLV